MVLYELLFLQRPRTVAPQLLRLHFVDRAMRANTAKVCGASILRLAEWLSIRRACARRVARTRKAFILAHCYPSAPERRGIPPEPDGIADELQGGCKYILLRHSTGPRPILHYVVRVALLRAAFGAPSEW
jgi:hypothetical protein